METIIVLLLIVGVYFLYRYWSKKMLKASIPPTIPETMYELLPEDQDLVLNVPFIDSNNCCDDISISYIRKSDNERMTWVRLSDMEQIYKHYNVRIFNKYIGTSQEIESDDFNDLNVQVLNCFKDWAKKVQDRKEYISSKMMFYHLQKDSSKYSLIRFRIDGIGDRPEDDIIAAQEIKLHDLLYLEPDPTNSQDPFAVKILDVNGHHIGYVESDYAPILYNNTKNDSECIVVEVIDSVPIPTIWVNILIPVMNS